MWEGFKEVRNEVKDVKSKLKQFREETNKRFDNLDDKLNDLEAANDINHVSIKDNLNKVSDNLDFLGNKAFQTERDLYHIKERLNYKIHLII